MSAGERSGRSERIARALGTIPELPRWVEARAILLSGQCEVFGEEGAWAVRNEEPGGRVVVVAGRAESNAIRAALADRPDRELLGGVEEEQALAALFPDWVCERAQVFELAHPGQLAAPDARVRLLTDTENLERLAEELHGALDGVRKGCEIHAAFVDGTAVSLALAHWRTENYFDISIDTVPSHRRRGLARAAVSALIRTETARGLQPVWGAMTSNQASQKLAISLGFEPIDQTVSLQRP